MIAAEPTAETRGTPAIRAQVICGGVAVEATVCDRQTLDDDTSIAGPAIIRESGSTTFVPPGWHVRRGPLRTLTIDRGTV
ncbi:hypothetical protein B1R94_14370 [Mycolicibacterium litorale]|nr:hypothetical protein B1R94_14370 [Mycolicibacterium litorale]